MHKISNVTSLLDLLRQRATTIGDRTAYIFLPDGDGDEVQMSYAQLRTRAQAIAAYLQRREVAPGEPVLLLFEPGPEYLCAFFGCLYSGALPVPAYPPTHARHLARLCAVVEDARAKFAFTTAADLQRMEKMQSQSHRLPVGEWLLIDAADTASNWQEPALDASCIAFLQYTSGSTSAPKGVMVSHGNLLKNIELIGRAIHSGPDDVGIIWLPPYHDFGLIGGILCPLFWGHCCVLMRPKSFLLHPLRWLKAISDYRGTITGAPNFAYDLCVRDITSEQRAALDLSSLRVVFNGAEPIRADTLHAFTDAFEPCGFRPSGWLPAYGLAESTLMVSGRLQTQASSGQLAAHINVSQAALAQHAVQPATGGMPLISAGPILPEHRVAIVNPDTLARCDADNVGEIWVQGPCVARGYWKRNEQTRDTFSAHIAASNEGPYLRTGDLGFMHENELYICGRLKDLIIIKGRNIYPQDVEAASSRSHRKLRENGTVAFVLEEDGTERLLIAQELDFRKEADEEVFAQIATAISQEIGLPPDVILLVKAGALPRTSSGKLQRQQCKQNFIKGELAVAARWDRPQVVAAPDASRPGNEQALAPRDEDATSIEAWLCKHLADRLGLPVRDIEREQPFAYYGLDSMSSVQLSETLSAWLGRPLSATMFWDYPSIAQLARFLAGENRQHAIAAIPHAKAHVDEPIAIIGMSCRFPGAANVNAFWRLLDEGRDGIRMAPAERIAARTFLHSPSNPPHTGWAGFLDQVDLFDPQFFGISPLEAQRIDPQQRLVLEVAWEALEDAGIAPASLAGSSAGVFVGLSTHDFDRLQTQASDGVNVYAATGSAASIAANRVSYLLDLRGPSIAVDTACSSSLVAVHMACQSLRQRESDHALAGGVNLVLSSDSSAPFAEGGMLSPDGRCKAFDAGANGYVRGEGCGMIVLKRLSDALRDGDDVRAVIRGSTVRQDGRSNGLIAPNGKAQADVIRQALAQAQLAPKQIGYVEAHGTGTALGDPIELNALKEVLVTDRAGDQACAIGSVKTNIGHLEAAAGIAGLIKTVLVLERGTIPANLHLHTPNPHCSLSDTPLVVPTKRQHWESTGERYAGVSSFGFGGTIAHMIIAQAGGAPEKKSASPCWPRHLLTFSAKNQAALDAMTVELAQVLREKPGLAIEDVAYTHQTGRSALPFRRMLVCSDSQDAAQVLAGSDALRLVSGNARNRAGGIAFIFPGQGAQKLQMARELYEHVQMFRSDIDQCSDILQTHLGFDLRELIYAGHANEDAQSRLNETANAQPALFVIEYALARLWMRWGVRPDALIGHSLGEYVAACLSGVFSLEDALALVAARGRLMQSLPRGAMLSVMLTEEEIGGYLAGSLSLAAINGTRRCVVSGEHAAISALEQRLNENNISCQRLSTSHAFHSSMMDPVLEPFRELVAQCRLQRPGIPFISNVTGTWVTDAEAIDPGYWVRHLRQTVRFADGLATLASGAERTLLEVGPGATLGALARQFATEQSAGNCDILASLSRDSVQSSDLACLLEALGRMWIAGHDIAWAAFYAGQEVRRLRLPFYPFQRERHWIDPASALAPARHIGVDPSAVAPASDAPAQERPATITRSHAMPVMPTSATDRKNSIRASVRALVAELLRIEPDRIDPDAPLLELGADSLILLQAVRKIEQAFGITITIRQLFEELTSITKVVDYLDLQLPTDWGREPAQAVLSNPVSPDQPQPVASIPPVSAPPQTPPSATPSAAPMERLILQQLDNMAQMTQQMSQVMMQQLKVLQTGAMPTPAAATPAPPALQKTAIPAGRHDVAADASVKFDPYASLDRQQQTYLHGFVNRFGERTRHSKNLTAKYRPVLADYRAQSGFRFSAADPLLPLSLKELFYPIVADRSEGARIWDVDGNEYIDLTMGFGVHLFGHGAPFIQQALREQSQHGAPLGPQSPLAGEVAELVHQLTGMERVAFCNSGTEAVMLAIRLARTATGRQKIALFSGSYHGWADGTLLGADAERGTPGAAMPVVPGLPAGLEQHVLVLEYGSADSLEVIRAHAGELAAVLVEPVQGRRPELQPREFLHALRALTREHEVPLIFDEMITGFRLHPRGAQAWFDVQADLVTYGKAAGGGMPLGIVAGRARYMDGVDGGARRLSGDGSASVPTTFFAGTFSKHPLTMAATRAVLQRMMHEGPSLQARLNARTTGLVERLNRLFTAAQLPMQVVQCGSLFRLNALQNLDLFCYHLVAHGVYVWEGRNMYLSTAHSDADLDAIVQAFEASIRDMREGGFFPSGDDPSGGSERASQPDRDASADSATAPVEVATGNLAISQEVVTSVRMHARRIDFSLSFFGAYEAGYDDAKYDLMFKAARFADAHGFTALWLPERHFHAFGGLSPNPSVLAAALARETQQIGLRAGSVVLPLHHPIRVAEEWSMVDNLSRGRVGIALASGWHPNDFVFAPQAFGNHRELMFEGLERLRTLWRGLALRVQDGAARDIDVTLFPLPCQPDLPIWITIVNNPDTYRRAGELGAGVLTNLMGQTIEDLEKNIGIYRQALAAHGHDPDKGHVTVLLHTFVGEDAATARQQAREPFLRYLRSSVGLFQNLVKSVGLDVNVETLSDDDRNYLLASAYERYANSSALIGSPESCRPVIDRLRAIGVDEIACFIDFGVDPDDVMHGMRQLDALRSACHASSDAIVSCAPPARKALPLTPTQQGMWLECQLNDNASLMYNTASVIRLFGALDRDALQAALGLLVQRHEALRTVISADGESQRVLSALTVELPVVSFLHEEDVESAVERWLVANNHEQFDLAQGPLVRACLLQKREDGDLSEHLFVLTIHHLVIDGVSHALLLQELADAYSALCQGQAPALPPAQPFSSYVSHLQSYLQSPDFAADESYWLGRFSGALPPALSLPTDRPHQRQSTGRAQRQTFAVAGDDLARLELLNRRHGCTMFMTMLASVTVLLQRITNDEDIVVGTPMSVGRPDHDDGHLVGCTANLVLVRCRPRADLPFSGYLAEIRRNLVEVYTHAEYPFSLLIRKLALPHDPGRRPLASVVFNIDRPAVLPRFAGLTCEPAASPASFGQDDLLFDITQFPDRLLVNVQYKEELFDPTTIARLLGHFDVLLKAIVAEPDTRIRDLALLTPAERTRMLVEWNDTTSAYPRTGTIHQLFEAQAAQTPEAVALVFEQQQLTYDQLSAKANQLAHHLRRLGVGPDVLVGICIERSLEMVIGLLAVLKAGGAYVPLDPDYPADRLAFMLGDTNPAVLLTQRPLLGLLPPHPAPTLCLDDWAALAHEPAHNPDQRTLPQHLAYVIYTSGSTGKPKGVQIPHEAVVNFLDSMQRQPGIAPHDVVVNVTSLSFDIAGLELMLPLISGARLQLASRETAADPHQLAALIDSTGVSFMQATPSTCRMLLAGGWPIANPQLKVLCGGEALSPDLASQLLTRVPAVWNMYGPTETTIWSTLHCLDHATALPLIGKPIANTQVYILDEYGNPAPIGVAGELHIAGDGLARGYLKRPALCAERFVPNPFGAPGSRMYRTGDLARWRADGHIECLGRTDHQIKLRGFRIDPGEIEVQLGRHPQVRQAVVVAREDVPGDKRLVAYLVVQEPMPAIEDLRAHLQASLPQYMLPAAFVLLDALPLTPNGKLDRKALPAPDLLALPARQYAAPQGDIEIALAALWQALLHVEQVGRHDSFFDLGGNSLLVTALIARLRATFRVDLPVRTLFGADSLAAMARLIEQQLAATEAMAANDEAGFEEVFNLLKEGNR